MKYPSGPGLIVAAALALAVSPLSGRCADAQKTGLEFLDPIPEFRGLSLQMSEEQLKAQIKKHGLYSRRETRPDSPGWTNGVSYWLLTPDGENVFVGFNSGKCGGIQRMQPIPKEAIKNEIGEAEYRKWLEERGSMPSAHNSDGWSQAVNGLRGRLEVRAPDKPDSPFCRVLIEFENVDEILGQKHIRFSPGKLSLRVTDQTGKELRIATGPYDGVSPVWETIALPHGGSTKFKIEICGLGYRPDKDKLIVDVGSDKAWVIPQDGKKYYLSGSLTIEKKEGDNPYMEWSGTIVLKKAEIPALTFRANPAPDGK